ncbi:MULTISPECIES: DUF3943 domain-containing protein [Legionella]|uniref:DUF3943 domain-containing protein n=1 Tax=Legionella resiliens TaxID=2905958 RepID=A0ABS8X6Z8_9GAMM|nr:MULTISPECIES: DUF3943 domain-containing protein [unclassified Legionella]MCE0723900.1 DUF3943 domain-containing protein [Legionella sp. 9fVS26]MCE3533052.1 DUF3943 domain-containing protein [Legionella sp. 8cVS16]QLZ69245.1 hypothetical protein FOLKNPGA_02027 [Legionella sp. PC1000]
MELFNLFLMASFVTLFFLSNNSHASNPNSSIIAKEAPNKICHLPQYKKSSSAICQAKNQQVNTFCKRKNNYTIQETAFQVMFTKNHTTTQKNYLLAAGETVAFLIGYTIRYYNNHEFNAVDWDFTLHSSIKNRLNGSAVRFDDNLFATNRGHFFAGAGYYSIARLNGLNRFYSILYTAAASSIWEYVTEFREVVSINDQINTIWGGFVIGETYNEVIKIFQYLPSTPLNNALGCVFKAPKYFLDLFSVKIYKEAPRNYFDSNYSPWSMFDIYSGYFTTQYELPKLFSHSPANGKSNLSGVYFGLNTQLIDIPMFEQVGEVNDFLTDNVFGQLLFEDYYNSKFNTLNFFAKTTLGAYYSKKLSYDKRGYLKGHNLFIGPSVAVQIKMDDVLNDFYSALHLLGLTIDMTTYLNNFKIRSVLDIYGDFTMMNAYAFQRYKIDHDVQNEFSVLRNFGYYYGMGYTTDALFTVDYKRGQIGGGIININANMIPNRSRFFRPHTGCGGWCKKETTKLNLSDFRLNIYAWASFKLINHVKIQLSVQKNEITGKIRGWGKEQRSETSKAIALVYSLQN